MGISSDHVDVKNVAMTLRDDMSKDDGSARGGVLAADCVDGLIAGLGELADVDGALAALDAGGADVGVVAVASAVDVSDQDVALTSLVVDEEILQIKPSKILHLNWLLVHWLVAHKILDGNVVVCYWISLHFYLSF